MKNRKSLALIIAIACISAATVIFIYGQGLLEGIGVNSSRISANKSGADTPDENPQLVKLQRDFVYPTHSLRDPFQRSQTETFTDGGVSARPEKNRTVLTLTGIIWRPEAPIAIITDSEKKSHLAKAGDAIGGTKVVKVHRKGIVIEKDGKRQELLLWPEDLEDQNSVVRKNSR